jgi:hypothetical protein
MSSLTRRSERHIQLVLGPVVLADGTSQTRVAIDVQTEVDVPTSEWPALLMQAARLVDHAVGTTSEQAWPTLLQLKASDPDPAPAPVPVPALANPRRRAASTAAVTAQVNHRQRKRQEHWKTQPCRYGAACRGEATCRGYHGEHDRIRVVQ